MHTTNLVGQTHIYSYVEDKRGVWWKSGNPVFTQVHSVTLAALIVITDQTPKNQVSEDDVLSDPRNLYPNSGVYVLMYSRHQVSALFQIPCSTPLMLLR